MAKKGFAKLLILLVVVTFAVFFAALTVKTFRVADEAMSPTFRNGQKIVINKLAYLKSSPTRGHVIVTGSAKPMMRRIVGLPGETVEIKKGIVYINGEPLNEPYLANVQENDLDEKVGKIDTDHYLVLADNRSTVYYRGTKISMLAWVPKTSMLGKYWFSY